MLTSLPLIVACHMLSPTIAGIIAILVLGLLLMSWFCGAFIGNDILTTLQLKISTINNNIIIKSYFMCNI